MNKYKQSGFIRIITVEDNYVDKEEIEFAFLELVNTIFSDGQSGEDIHRFYSRLNFLKAELLHIQKEKENRFRREKVLEKEYAEKLTFFVDSQIEFVKWLLRHPHDYNLFPKQDNYIEKINSDFYWTGTSADLTELVYGLVESGAVNKGDTNIDSFAQFLSSMLKHPLTNLYATLRDIKKRKDESRTYFIDKMGKRLNQRMNNGDENIYPKKHNRGLIE